MISRFCVQCSVCGTKTITRTAVIDILYQEFAFPCPGCSVEIRFGMTTHAPNWEYIKLINAKPVDWSEDITNVMVFDAGHLIPLDGGKSFSPFMATAQILDGDDLAKFYLTQGIEQKTVDEIWSQVERLITHFQRGQWDLFDAQLTELYKDDANVVLTIDKKNALYRTLEQYSTFFRRESGMPEIIKDRINLAESTSSAAINDLIQYFVDNNKYSEIDGQIQNIRQRWTKIYHIVAPVFITRHWDKSKYSLANYTLAQKRFDDLKGFYIDCFETFCRISVIAAGIEGIITIRNACVSKARGVMTLEQFDIMHNGSKSDILARMAIADIFVPFIEHRLRNGIGHNAAHYDVVDDRIDYQIENQSGVQKFSIPYIEFCEKVVSIYEQLELVSLYSNWLQLH